MKFTCPTATANTNTDAKMIIMTMKSNDPKMIAYLPVMYCVNCTGGEAEETLMLMLVLVRWR
jgi:hypothetical protein